MSGHMEFARTTNILLVEQGFFYLLQSWVASDQTSTTLGPDGPTSSRAAKSGVAPSTAQAWFLWTQKQEWNPNQLGILIKIKSGDEISLTSLRPPNALAFSKEKKTSVAWKTITMQMQRSKRTLVWKKFYQPYHQWVSSLRHSICWSTFEYKRHFIKQ